MAALLVALGIILGVAGALAWAEFRAHRDRFVFRPLAPPVQPPWRAWLAEAERWLSGRVVPPARRTTEADFRPLGTPEHHSPEAACWICGAPKAQKHDHDGA